MSERAFPGVNALSGAMRAGGGLNVFFRMTVDVESRRRWSNWFAGFFDDAELMRCRAETEDLTRDVWHRSAGRQRDGGWCRVGGQVRAEAAQPTTYGHPTLRPAYVMGLVMPDECRNSVIRARFVRSQD